MRLLRAISDLPWWTGMPIFLIGNVLVAFSLFWFIIGLMICLFGCWVFSKLLNYTYSSAGYAMFGLPIFMFFMFNLREPYMHNCSFEQMYMARAIVGMFVGFITFKGFKK